ncbi:hypothetical protein KXD93_26465 [Mucilaginibacter sp. BJC16-A38]|uniref:zeta toxin family protein n=1 Tax=Mucilaginibacter phenanthrenivorans TaxID=1234842 RepID=UPI00215893BB|nr:zeta toxin family protein [Mucilaginibacter phenanthrenivorans]MCR8561224.1 hypothetical protein [Mucilaginibacter phenanthrenivorans]
MPPKFRMFAGPNGSGKTSLFEYLRSNGSIHTELYINADRYEREIKANSRFNFNAYRVSVSQKDFIDHIKSSTLFHEKIKESIFLDKINIKAGILKFAFPKNEINSYHASFIASFLVEKLLETGQSFCYETVMSHESKVDLLGIAKSKGYKTYLYFVYTDNPELNIMRVGLRALMGLHNVNPEVIRSRYERSFALLPKALEIADDAYIVNNSDGFAITLEKHNNKIVMSDNISDTVKKLLS